MRGLLALAAAYLFGYSAGARAGAQRVAYEALLALASARRPRRP